MLPDKLDSNYIVAQRVEDTLYIRCRAEKRLSFTEKYQFSGSPGLLSLLAGSKISPFSRKSMDCKMIIVVLKICYSRLKKNCNSYLGTDYFFAPIAPLSE